MNKFLKRVRGAGKEEYRFRIKVERSDDDLQALEEFQACWASLSEVRRKAQRSAMYAWGDQWGDLVRDPDTGQYVTEGDLIKKQGKVPLKNNMIAPILNNIVGQFRNAHTKPVCVVRDQHERKLGEMMSVALEYVHDINEVKEVDAVTLKELATAGNMVQRLEYGPNPAKGNCVDIWLYNVNPTRVFYNSSIEDVRQWDITHIGEIMDLPIQDVIAEFSQCPADERAIREIYGNLDRNIHVNYNGLQGDKNKDMTFYTAAEPGLCRVILGWKLESREGYMYHDTVKGEWGYVAMGEKHLLDEENNRRVLEGREYGVPDEEMLLIEYEYKVERYWQYRYLTPDGFCLRKGRSPFWHGEHNYVFGVHQLIQGELFNFVEQFIDQQRAINRTATLIDFIRSASSKGVLIVDDTAFEGMTREQIVEEYVRYNGVLFATLKPGQDIGSVIRQLSGNATVAGDYELLNLQLKLINEISGVNSAMQGQAPKSGTPSTLYAQQVQNSSLNLKDLLDTMTAFLRRRDMKMVKMIQQYYRDERYLNLAGRDYSEEAKWYRPEMVKNAEVNLVITDGNNTPAYQMLANDFLMQLFQAGAIDAKAMLENSSYPYAAKILESIKRGEAEMRESMQPGAAVNGQMAVAMDNNNARPGDGVVMRA